MIILTILVIVAAFALAALCLRISRRRRDAQVNKAEIENAQRMAYLGHLAGGLAHEIRNPLSSMSMNLQLLAEDLRAPTPPAPDRLETRIQTIQSEVRRLSEILDNFLRFARRPELNLSDENINEVVAEVLTFVSAEAERGNVRILKNLSPDVPRCRADRDALKQALLNVIINAKEAMPGGGELMVRTARERQFVRIDVTDTGEGMPREVLQQIFQPYFSTKNDGSGLGLPIAKRIIEEHGGRVSVYSEPGRGTSVSFLLPARG